MKTHYLKWSRIVVFQLLYGLAIFVVTRDIYMREPTTSTVPAHASVATRPTPAVPGSSYFTVTDAEQLVKDAGSGSSVTDEKDYKEVARMADEQFGEKNYAQAARLYKEVLSKFPHNVDVYNNLGLTLHYINQSEEAVEQLKRGISIDEGHQRIWLTLGFVQSQTGKTEEARRAFQRAIEIDSSSEVGSEAARMMNALR